MTLAMPLAPTTRPARANSKVAAALRAAVPIANANRPPVIAAARRAAGSALTPQHRRPNSPRDFSPDTNSSDTDPITRAILHLAQHWDSPPSLDDLAEKVAHASPAHFQRLFKSRVGISPKRFCQHLTLTRAKDLLARRTNLLDTSHAAGLSGPSRLHDLFISAEAMTPGEYKERGRTLVIRWGTADSPIGPALLAITDRGLCWLGFSARPHDIEKLHRNWSAATLLRDDRAIAPIARRIFGAHESRARQPLPLPVLLRGTNFQIQVWRALLRIPHGAIATYGDIAHSLEREIPGATRAVRAVAAACGTNPVSYVIPCHRVIQSTGTLCGYGWGLDKKRALLALEGNNQ